MSDLALLLRLQACVNSFLAGLSRDRLVALVEGRATLSVTDRVDGRPLAAAPQPRAEAVSPPSPATAPRSRRPSSLATIDAESVVVRLRACETRDQGAELLAEINLSAVDLRQVAKALSIPTSGRKDELTKKILLMTLGNRAKHAGLRQG
ncbi:hypothetical protein ACTI_33780 [Actinoplanes sp. OR16]|uniref:hypothetical protein n=1 Tax=Actinoplanes sp. OR16 TaxID=946334 RepID=UPI000F71E6D4|nr:hypothetical protein [Actinoplanes sp. OR16]BBH66693.1 hypothetical protein ACTI_33780 [Actinoplanes sp. OR16]